MKLSIPTTWDDRVLDLVRAHPVYTVYGALDFDPVGGGKPGEHLPVVSRDGLARHVAAVREAGAPFTYLLNAACMGNREFSPEGHRAIVSFLGFLADIGVEYVTVSVPQLVDIVRRHAPSLEVRVSTIAFVNSPQQARFFEELGAREITLDFNVNRDFQRLRAIRRAVSLDLSVIVNDFCLLRCPWAPFHYNAIGHGSRDDGGAPYVDSYSLSCKSRLVENPVEMLRAPWIRPEDMARYEAIGIHHFKIAGRGKAPEYIERVVRAYAARRWDGNLMELLEGVSGKVTDEQVRFLDRLLSRAPRLTRAALRIGGGVLSRLDRSGRGKQLSYLAKLSPETARRLVNAFHALARSMERVDIDNGRLDGFLDRFERVPCGDCGGCTWCDEWTERAVTSDPHRTAEAVQRAAEALEHLTGGGS